MRMALATGLAAVFAMTMAVPALAGGVEQRQQNQQRRIRQGVHSGALTPGEAARLERQQFRIERMERNLKVDGDFSRRDRARVHHRQDKASKRIWRAKHNRRVDR